MAFSTATMVWRVAPTAWARLRYVISSASKRSLRIEFEMIMVQDRSATKAVMAAASIASVP